MTEVIKDKKGVKYYLNRKLHREDGPAFESYDGTKEWYRNGQKHREDGPAVESCDGTKEWYRNDQKHREDGPAVERPNGTKEWYFDDQRHRKHGPAIELPDGTKEWYFNGKLHREDGPVREYGHTTKKPTKEWYINGDELDLNIIKRFKKFELCKYKHTIIGYTIFTALRNERNANRIISWIKLNNIEWDELDIITQFLHESDIKN
jgi:hypothetical protein